MVTGPVKNQGTNQGTSQGTSQSTNRESDQDSDSLRLKAGAATGGGRAVLTAL